MTETRKLAEACREAAAALGSLGAPFAAIPSGACEATVRGVETLLTGTCGIEPFATTSTDRMAACLVGEAREQFAALLGGGKDATADGDRAARVDRTAQALMQAHETGHVRSLVASVKKGTIRLTDLLDIGLRDLHYLHLDPRKLHQILAAVGPKGVEVQRLIMRYGKFYGAMSDLAAAQALVTATKDAEALRALEAAAMSGAPTDRKATGRWYGRATRAMGYLVQVKSAAGAERLADIAVNAPIFTDPQSPAPRMERAKQGLIGKTSAPRIDVRGQFVGELLTMRDGPAALATAMAARRTTSPTDASLHALEATIRLLATAAKDETVRKAAAAFVARLYY